MSKKCPLYYGKDSPCQFRCNIKKSTSTDCYVEVSLILEGQWGPAHPSKSNFEQLKFFFIQQTPSHENRPKMLMSFHLFFRPSHFTSANCRTAPDFKVILKRANVAPVFHTLMCHPVVKAEDLGCSCGFQGAVDINCQPVYIIHNPTFYSFCLKWFARTP